MLPFREQKNNEALREPVNFARKRLGVDEAERSVGMCVLPCQSLRRSRIIHKVRLRHLRRELFKQPARLRELPISEMDERQIEYENRQSGIGEELGVRYIVEGGVRKSGRRVRVTAQLI